MYEMNHDFFDSFVVQFSQKESIVQGVSYPLGHFATEALDLDANLYHEIKRQVAIAQEDVQMFLAARSVSAGAMAHSALMTLWTTMGTLPLYEKLSPTDAKIHLLIGYMRAHPEEVDDMVTRGTERNQMLMTWLRNLSTLVSSLTAFQQNTSRMLDDYFEQLPARNAEQYTRAYALYKKDLREGYDLADQEDEDTSELDSIQMNFPFSLAFCPQIHPKTGTPFLAEEISFGTLSSFLYTDLMKGMIGGNIPRRCHNCGKYFLAVGGYDTVYCNRIAPSEQTKTCRKIGAHKKEKAKNGATFIDAEYTRTYNRLKGRKQRGRMNTDEWNVLVAKAQELKAKARAGGISDGDYRQRLEAL